MKRIVIILIGLVSVAYGQSSPTSSKTRFVNGLYVGTKLDSYFAAADSNAIYWRADSVVMAKYKGTARALAFSSDLGVYKLIADTFFTGGYTTRVRTKQQIDSLAATKLSPSDSATYFNQVVRTFGTQTIGGTKTFSGVLNASSDLIFRGGNNNKIEWDSEDGVIYTNGGSFLTLGAAGNASNMVFDRLNARWGIGTIPTTTFDVNGTVRATALRQSSLANSLVKADANGVLTAAVAGTDYVAGGTGTTNYIPKFTASGAIGNSLMFDNGSGVGIGTLSPTYRFQILNVSATDADIFQAGMTGVSNGLTVRRVSSAMQMSFDGKITGNSGVFLSTLSIGGEGIGRANTLRVNGPSVTSASNTYNAFISTNTTQAADIGGSLGLGGDVGGADTAAFAVISGRKENSTSGNYAGYFAVSTLDGGASMVEKFRVSSDGTFLINTTTTDGTNKLIVNGGVKGTNIIANGDFVSQSSGATKAVLYSTSGKTAIQTIAGQDIVFEPATVEKFRMDATTGAATFSSSVTASSLIKSGGTSTQALIADGSVQTLTSGTYTPTLTNGVNITSSTTRLATYTRIGNVVTVYGQVDITTTAVATTTFQLSLPIASNIGVTTDLTGTATFSNTPSNPAYSSGNSTNDTADFAFIPSLSGLGVLYYTFQYRVI